MLTHPRGSLMVSESIRKLFEDMQFNSIAFVGIREHARDYKADQWLAEAVATELALPKDFPVRSFWPGAERAGNVAGDIAMAIEALNIKGPIAIKDCDNSFRLNYGVQPPEETANWIALGDMRTLERVTARNKSYATLHIGLVQGIAEKQMVSPWFCAGLYRFADAAEYVEAWKRANNSGCTNVSHVIYQMLLYAKTFSHVAVEDYQDWGTIEDWRRFCAGFKTLLVDLDGMLVHASAKWFGQRWGTTEELSGNVATLRRLHAQGRLQIIVTSARHESARDLTENQLRRLGIPFDQLVLGLWHCQRVLANDYCGTNPFPSAVALSLPRDSDELSQIMETLA
jgi:hypothetical protein